MSDREPFFRASGEVRYGQLLVALVLVAISPFVLPERVMAIGTSLLFMIVLLSALAAVADSRSHLLIGVALAVPAVATHWLYVLAPSLGLGIVSPILALLFMAYVAKAILGDVIRAERVRAGTIYGAICVYLLVALLWGEAYRVIETVQPGSLAVAAHADPVGRLDSTYDAGPVMYFSFVTLTTLGYGDVTPVSNLARMLAVFEAVFGQLFLVVLVARLVGLHTALDFARLAARPEPDADGPGGRGHYDSS